MPKVSSATASKVEDFEVAEERSEDLEGYTVSFTTIRQSADMTPMLADLPDGRCQCPHWGYVLSGELTVRYADHREVISAGDAFYLPPGHVPSAIEDTRFVLFSPADVLVATDEAIRGFMQSMQSAQPAAT